MSGLVGKKKELLGDVHSQDTRKQSDRSITGSQYARLWREIGNVAKQKVSGPVIKKHRVLHTHGRGRNAGEG